MALSDLLLFFLVNGLQRIAIYAPAALAFYIIFRATKIIDFGVIATATIAIYLAVFVAGGTVGALQIPVALATAAIIGPALYFALWRPVMRHGTESGPTFLCSVALLGAAQAIASLVLTAAPVPFFDLSLHVGRWLGVPPFYKDVVTRVIVCGAVCVIAIRMMDHTLAGKQICAIGEGRFLASLHIFHLERLIGLAYLSASFLATLSVVLDAGSSNLDPFSPLQVLLFGVISFLLGGQRSAKQAAGGAMLWGFLEVLMEYVVGLSLARALLLVLCTIVIVFRGESIGLFDVKALERPE